jgi:hypothetical protein
MRHAQVAWKSIVKQNPTLPGRQTNGCAQSREFKRQQIAVSKALKNPVHVDLRDIIKEISEVELKKPPGTAVPCRTTSDPSRAMEGKRRRMRYAFLKNLPIYELLDRE